MNTGGHGTSEYTLFPVADAAIRLVIVFIERRLRRLSMNKYAQLIFSRTLTRQRGGIR